MIRIFIVTYKCPHLNANLKSIFESDANPNDYSVSVIVNDPDYFIDEEYKDRVTIHMQTLRFTSNNVGHLARDWNQALIKGFGNLESREAEQVILCQDDMIWDKDWKQKLDEIHEKYTFYTCSWGDGFLSFKVNAVRRVGLFDERFVGVGYHEGDYFLRQFIFNNKYSSINDHWHDRVWNPTFDVARRTFIEVRELKKGMPYNRWFWKEKWGEPILHEKDWTQNLFRKSRKDQLRLRPLLPYRPFYPAFERDIPISTYTAMSLLGDKMKKRRTRKELERHRELNEALCKIETIV